MRTILDRLGQLIGRRQGKMPLLDARLAPQPGLEIDHE